MSSAQVNAVPQAQKYGEKRGKSGKEMVSYIFQLNHSIISHDQRIIASDH